MKKLIAAAVLALTMTALFAEPEQVFLWPKKVGPGSEKVKVEHTFIERSKDPTLLNRAETGITEPYFTVYKPENPNGVSLLICPGGTYERVVTDVEGIEVAQYFSKQGITCFLLSYRLPNDGHKNAKYVALADAQRAMRIIRTNAESYGISKYRIGVMGFSAGGHLAATLSTKASFEAYKKVDAIDEENPEPDFEMLIYPVITMSDKAHAGSRKALLGEKPKDDDVAFFSCENNVTRVTAPAFIVCATNDTSVKPEFNAIAYYNAMVAARAKAELHVFQESGHGFGIRNALGSAKYWPELATNWIMAYQAK